MKDIISITELARLRNVSTETLRHYDRIGLFKPSYVDPNTGYRYYSILYQNEKLGTIRELQQLGMSLQEIKDYYENRNVEKSLEILKQKKNELKKKIVDLQALYSVISNRIETVENIKQQIHFETPFIQHLPQRMIISNGIECEDDVNLSYQVLQMERLLEGLAPTVATNRFGVIRKLYGNQFGEKLIPLIFQQFGKNVKECYLRYIPEGDFACLFYKGDIWKIDRELDVLEKYISENDFKYAGDLIQILQIDISISGSPEEMVIELQIPVARI